MPVPLPKLCAVLAHELRSPLSVIQGYIRLMQRQRDRDHPDSPMLDAMLSATARLTAIAREASDLSGWLTTTGSAPLPSVPLGAVLDALAERALKTPGVQLVAATPPVDLRLNAEPGLLADAILALAGSMARETGEPVVTISTPDSSTPPTQFVLRACSLDGAVSHHTGAQRAGAFDRGGAGLALILASYVLDAHGATVQPHDEASVLSIQIPPERGTS